MYLPDVVFEILTGIGMGAGENAGEFWFAHREKVAAEINKRFGPTDFQRFEDQIRWKTPIGIELQAAVRESIQLQQEANVKNRNEALGAGKVAPKNWGGNYPGLDR